MNVGHGRRVGFAAALVVVLASASVEAHLLPADAATLNVTEQAIFAVVSVPVSALNGFDDDGDGQMSGRELDTHREALTRDITKRFQISTGEQTSNVVRLDLLLSPEHEAVQDRADHVLALEHVALNGRPSAVELRTDLFDRRAADPHLTVTASQNKAAATAQTVELRPSAPGFLFPMDGQSVGTPSRSRPSRVSWPRVAAAVAIAGAAAATAWAAWRRRRSLPARGHAP